MADLIDPFDLSDPSDYPAAMKRDAATIAELQKRANAAEHALAAERRQREEADNILRYGLCVLGIAKAAEAYFARYPSEKVAG